jgi:hypothetical protein
MPWINGRWRPEGWQTGGFDKGPVSGGFPGLLDMQGPPSRDGKDGVQVPIAPNPFQQPIYGQGPQMQPTFGPTQWAGPNAIYPNWDDPEGPYANDVALTYVGDPYQPHTPWQSGLAPRQPWTPPPVQQQRPIQGQPIPPQFPSLPPQMDPPRPPQYPVINPEGGWDPDPGIPGQEDPDPEIIRPRRQPLTDHEYNVQQREKTKLRLANARSRTKAHLANLRGKGVSAKTIAKAKAKAQGRYAKIKGQSLRRGTTNGEAEK